MSDSVALFALEDFGALQFRGPDAAKFLQGQLSNDMARLAPGSILRAGLHNPQGRTLALLWLVARAEDEILALLPAELLLGVMAQLRRFVLRSKLSISDVSAQTRIHGIGADSLPPSLAALRAHIWSFAAGRRLLIQDGGAQLPPLERASREQWRALDIAAGLPQVYAPTAAQFVAQMLNLDCIDAVAFDKGCYTGQEVIARAHFRGRVKRRMQRFESLEPRLLRPGDAGRLEDGRPFRVVESVQRSDGRSEFLAVAPLGTAAGTAAGWAAGGAAAASSDAEPSSAAGDAASLPARALPLPYALPD